MKTLIFFILIMVVANCTTSTNPPSSLYRVVDTVKMRLDKTEIKVETMELAFTGFSKSQIAQINTMITTVTAPLSAQIKALQDTLKVYKSIGSSDFSKNTSGQTIISPAGIARIKIEVKKP